MNNKCEKRREKKSEKEKNKKMENIKMRNINKSKTSATITIVLYIQLAQLYLNDDQ